MAAARLLLATLSLERIDLAVAEALDVLAQHEGGSLPRQVDVVLRIALGAACTWLGAWAEAEVQLDHAVAWAETSRLPALAGLATSYLAISVHMQGLDRLAIALCDQVIDEIGSPLRHLPGRLHRATMIRDLVPRCGRSRAPSTVTPRSCSSTR